MDKRQIFEQFMTQELNADLEKDSEGNYINLFVANTWNGFIFGWNAAIENKGE
ncbi:MULTISPECIES: hypothetical protein [Providencia]|uniref:hypothetical protein n=1 Tax=Providencia TaxID=586 RepID=UPI00155E6307|nr:MULTISPECIES: hypothetical protein [unclassified Providencia]QKG44634.1 hypothetical protein HRD55_08575 [Providencia rettgeri]QLQ63938.1 hypothetical protein H0904_16135 [Providencia rettgeri]QNN34767.1 hypothetical protein H9X60_08580 [Providencia rettgeri]URR24052.1 hypothetical protein L3Q80_06350 [Providencia rettgeri]